MKEWLSELIKDLEEKLEDRIMYSNYLHQDFKRLENEIIKLKETINRLKELS